MSILSRYLASPRTGHLHQAPHIFHYLDSHSRSKIALNPTPIAWDDTTDDNDLSATPKERRRVMERLYPDGIEDLPPNMPEPLGKPVQINAFFDADHSGDRVTRRAHKRE